MPQTDFEIVSFDCYGTLIDWESGIVDAFKTEAARDGVILPNQDILSAYHAEESAVESDEYRPYSEVLIETARRAAVRLGWELDLGRARFLVESLPGWLPFPDTNTALEQLAARFQLGILSNVDDDLLATTLRHFPVSFDLIVTAQQVRSYKPSHAHFHEALKRTAGKKLLHAAQSYYHDVIPACEIGIPVVWVNRKAEQVDEAGPKPSHEVSDLTGLTRILVQ